ncbi:hypothetical protein SAMN05428960_0315 [Mitsuaria sp. PDC51]|uniref:GTPase-associated system all-helical protein GASH n=1 Tax=Mitsuaria sp. PDC51 TaxID=1881035 RepID=UPI0008E8E6E3|nr:GTPase-associated system all-helical protein GASH [Mitsuaria sp. PDC51]SFR71064.1 hypothetical protein SAMN05428960_0315 [Mitsuaria sp. PDC51]
MHKDFAGWYASLSLGEDADALGKRWASVVDVTEDTSEADMSLLVQVAFGLKTAPSELSVLKAKFTIPELPQPGDREVALLAAAVLFHDMDGNYPDAGLVASLIKSTSCFGLRAYDQPVDLIGTSENTLRKLSETSRRRPELEPTKALRTTLEANEVAAAAKHAESGQHVEAIKALAAATSKLVSAIVKRQNKFESDVKTFVTVQDEELDMLWWLHNGYSIDRDVPFAEVPIDSRPFVIARELARLTKVLPGPTALDSMLTRTGVSEGPNRSIASAVQGIDLAWINATLEALPEGATSKHWTPILFAFERRVETDGAAGWETPWAALTAMSIQAELSPMQLAQALYRELIVAQLG